MLRSIILAAVGFMFVLAGMLPAAAEDRHENYYYPEVETRETYVARAQTLATADREARIAFVTQLTLSQSSSPYPPQYAIFAKGSEGQKLIITALDADVFATLYRARGVMAQMTAHSRQTDFFQAYGVEDIFTFYDLLKLLGFEQLTITDGESWAHQITIE